MRPIFINQQQALHPIVQQQQQQQQHMLIIVPTAAAAGGGGTPIGPQWPPVAQQSLSHVSVAAPLGGPRHPFVPANAAHGAMVVDSTVLGTPATAPTVMQQQYPANAYHASASRSQPPPPQQQQFVMAPSYQRPIAAPVAAAVVNSGGLSRVPQQQQHDGLVLEYSKHPQQVSHLQHQQQQQQQQQHQTSRLHQQQPLDSSIARRLGCIANAHHSPQQQQQHHRAANLEHDDLSPVARLSHTKAQMPNCWAGLNGSPQLNKYPPGLKLVANSSRPVAAAAAAAGPTGGTTRLSAALKAAGWSAHIAQSAHQGRTYYYNKYTKVSTWRNPLADEQQLQQQQQQQCAERVHHLRSGPTAEAAAATALAGDQGQQHTMKHQQQHVSDVDAVCKATTITASAEDAAAASHGAAAAAAARPHEAHLQLSKRQQAVPTTSHQKYQQKMSSACTLMQEKHKQQGQQQQQQQSVLSSTDVKARAAAVPDCGCSAKPQIITHEDDSPNPGQRSSCAAAAAAAAAGRSNVVKDGNSDPMPTQVMSCWDQGPNVLAAAATSRDPADQEVSSKRDVSNAQPGNFTPAAAAAAQLDEKPATAAKQWSSRHKEWSDDSPGAPQVPDSPGHSGTLLLAGLLDDDDEQQQQQQQGSAAAPSPTADVTAQPGSVSAAAAANDDCERAQGSQQQQALLSKGGTFQLQQMQPRQGQQRLGPGADEAAAAAAPNLRAAANTAAKAGAALHTDSNSRFDSHGCLLEEQQQQQQHVIEECRGVDASTINAPGDRIILLGKVHKPHGSTNSSSKAGKHSLLQQPCSQQQHNAPNEATLPPAAGAVPTSTATVADPVAGTELGQQRPAAAAAAARGPLVESAARGPTAAADPRPLNAVQQRKKSRSSSIKRARQGGQDPQQPGKCQELHRSQRTNHGDDRSDHNRYQGTNHGYDLLKQTAASPRYRPASLHHSRSLDYAHDDDHHRHAKNQDNQQQREQREHWQMSQLQHESASMQRSQVDFSRRRKPRDGGAISDSTCRSYHDDARHAQLEGHYNTEDSLYRKYYSADGTRRRLKMSREGQQGDLRWQQHHDDRQGRTMFDALDASTDRYPMASRAGLGLGLPRGCRLPIDDLAPDLHDAIIELCHSRQLPTDLLRPEDFDEAVVRELNNAGLSRALYAIQELRRLVLMRYRDLQNVRDMPSLLLKIMREKCAEYNPRPAKRSRKW